MTSLFMNCRRTSPLLLQRRDLEDPRGLFNAGFEAKATRAIDFHEGDKINAAASKELVRAAVALNASGGTKKQK